MSAAGPDVATGVEVEAKAVPSTELGAVAGTMAKTRIRVQAEAQKSPKMWKKQLLSRLVAKLSLENWF